MRMPLVRGYSYFTRYSADTKTEHVELWEQPFHRWLIAVIYHWYDMRIYKVPGFKRLEYWLQDRHEDQYRAGDWSYLPLSAQQDLRCYSLTHRQRKVLYTLQLPE